MSHKLGICVPYRDRKEHIRKLVRFLSKHLDEQGIEYSFYIGHQVDDNPFNRGIMKNIAAHYAFNDGCDYIAWHDVDYIPTKNVDYGYPEKHPVLLVKNTLQESAFIDDQRYFGGCVLFNKEHAYKTNGYSNEYWGWGYEDADLLLRCEREKLINIVKFKKYEKTKIAKFNGKTSYIIIPNSKKLRKMFLEDNTIQILFYPELNEDDKIVTRSEDTLYKNYPILRKEDGAIWGINYNNRQQVEMIYYDISDVWIKSHSKNFHNQWMWVTITYSKKNKVICFYVNNKLVRTEDGREVYGPIQVHNDLSIPNIEPGNFILGKCNLTNEFYKGKIAKVNIYDKFFNGKEDLYDTKENLIYSLVFNKSYKSVDIEYLEEEIDIIEKKVPHYRTEYFIPLKHISENDAFDPYVLKNEKKYYDETITNKTNYKNDGINNFIDYVLEIDLEYNLFPNTTFINTKLKYGT